MAAPLDSHVRHSHLRSLAWASSLAWLAACAGTDDTTTTLATPDEPARPVLADGALQALAESPEVFAMGFPFFDAPRADQALLIDMSDGVRLAASLYFPAGGSSVRSPVVYVDEWYGRAVEATGTAIELYRAAGFVVALVDARGFGASFGSQDAFMTPRARQDQREVLDWLSSRPWSNGQVSAVGLSLSGSLVGVMTGSGSPHLNAAVIRAADYDQYATNLFPGGVPNINMIEGTRHFVEGALGAPCVDDLAACVTLGVEPVDGDDDLSLLRAALREHRTNVDPTGLESAIYRDDAVGGGQWSDMTPVERADAVVPARIVASWVDGLTADSALIRYASHPNTPMQLVIGSNTHMGGLDGDPFSTTPFGEARPSARESFDDDVAFLQSVLGGESIGRSIRYRVLGADAWRTSESWPPAGVIVESLALAPGALAVEAPTDAGSIRYRVDPSTSTGPFNRWGSQRANPIHYGDRRAAPGTLLSFDGPPAERDMEVVGNPELCLWLESDQPDGILLAYLEDVAPDGRITYLSEGELRLLHRATSGAPCDPAPGTARSFERRAGAAVVPGEQMQIELPLAATAALLGRGHHLRLSLAGADAGTFPTLTEAPATWSVGYGGSAPSSVRVPMRPWQSD